MRTRVLLFGGLAILATLVLWVRAFGFHRPYMYQNPLELAVYLVINDRPPEECWDLIVLSPFGPQPAVQRASCVREYATLTQDPTACEGLMPTEYGLSCINEIVTQSYKGRQDEGFFEPSECVHPSLDPKKKDWCEYLKAHRSHLPSDCTGIENSAVHEACVLKFEAWEKYPELRSSFYFGKNRQYRD